MMKFEPFKLYRKEVRNSKLGKDCLIVIQRDMAEFLDTKFRKIFLEVDDFSKIGKSLVAKTNLYVVDSKRQKELLHHHYPRKLINEYVLLMKKYIKYRIGKIFCKENEPKPLNYLFTQAIQMLEANGYWNDALRKAVPELSGKCKKLEQEVVIQKQKIVMEFYNRYTQLLHQVDALPFHYARERCFLKLFYLNPEIGRMKNSKIFINLYRKREFVNYGFRYFHSLHPEYKDIVHPLCFYLVSADYDVMRRTIAKKIERPSCVRDNEQYDALNLQRCIKHYKYLNIERKINIGIIEFFEDNFQESVDSSTYGSDEFDMYKKYISVETRMRTIKKLKESNRALEKMILTTSYLISELKPMYLRRFASVYCHFYNCDNNVTSVTEHFHIDEEKSSTKNNTVAVYMNRITTYLRKIDIPALLNSEYPEFEKKILSNHEKAFEIINSNQNKNPFNFPLTYLL